MEVLTVLKMVEVVCRAKKSWGIAVFIPETDDLPYLQKSIPWLDLREYLQEINDGLALVLFDTREEMQEKFERVVSDDYPEGDLVHIFCITCSPDGELLSENT